MCHTMVLSVELLSEAATIAIFDSVTVSMGLETSAKLDCLTRGRAHVSHGCVLRFRTVPNARTSARLRMADSSGYPLLLVIIVQAEPRMCLQDARAQAHLHTS